MPPESATDLVDPTLMRAQTRVGSVLREKWRLDRLLGVGGMAAVYAATHRNGTRGAIKMLHSELSTNSHVRSRFLKEGYVANKVDHPGVVRVLDDDVAEDGSLFIVMELLDGESLEERRVRLHGKLAGDEVLAAADQLLDVLAAAHGKGIIHRDIKPENIFLTRDGVVKVLDFGIARLRELSTASSATRAGTTMGTPAFMAPEHARGLWDEVDARSDLWSVGAAMFTLISGRTAHEGRTTNEVLLAAMSQPAPSLAIAANISKELAAVVDRALAFDKSDRWPDAKSMQEAVRRAFHGLHGAPISTHPKLTVPPSVPNKTLPSADVLVPVGLGSAGTGPALASGQTGVPLRGATVPGIPRSVVIAVAGVGAAFAVFAVLVVVGVAVSRSRTATPASAEAVPPNTDQTTSSPTASPAVSTMAGASSTSAHSERGSASAATAAPIVALEDLPTVGKSPAGAKTDAGVGTKAPGLPPATPDWKDQRR